ncbi:class I SAM-dependent methyltransferase [Sungkyunkwania multivorans]|uniref:Class I SAM-dependent methyltransferase n=1 Tax=Sungkyunkwania multivorans TaxID=1173618 RepID=A0ABW3CVV9_9FLAO
MPFNKHILDNANQSFIDAHLKTDISLLALKKPSLAHVSIHEIIEQIQSKIKCEKKLPTWYHTKNIYYPKKLSIEQSSSELTAAYKADLMQGKRLIDLTGGFGVDSLYFSKTFESVIHCEINEELSAIVSHNFKQLSVDNVETVAIDGLEYLKKTTVSFDAIYVDPARRDDIKGKVFKLSDCFPDVVAHLDLLFSHSDHILIKTSPMLDVKAGMRELSHIKEIHVVAVHNEVKELLWLLQRKITTQPLVKTINIKKSGEEHFSFSLADEAETTPRYSVPKQYLYEPNSAIMKAGAFNMIWTSYHLEKLHPHTHLYTSDELVDFPGRVFHIKEVLPNERKFLKKKLKNLKANVTVRNYPESVAAVRKKIGIKDGGDTFLFFTTNKEGKKIVLICEKVI